MNNLTKRLENGQAEVERLKGLMAKARGRVITEIDSERQFQADCDRGNQTLIDLRIGGAIVPADKFDKVTMDALAEKQLRNARSKTASQEIESYRTALVEKEAEIQSVRREILIAGLEHFPDDLVAANKRRIKAREILDNAESEDIRSRRAVIEVIKQNLIGKAESAMKFFEENLLPELSSKMTAKHELESPIREARTFSLVLNNQPDLIFTKIEFKLKQAAALAFILEEVFDDRQLKLTLLNHLKKVNEIAQMAVRNKSFVVTEWAFTGTSVYREWTTPEQIEPLRKFLKESDFYECV